jgi:hypothetical protein
MVSARRRYAAASCLNDIRNPVPGKRFSLKKRQAMPLVPKKRDPLNELIESLDRKQKAIENVVTEIQEIANDLPEEIEEKVLESLRIRVREALRDFAQDPGVDIGQLNPSSTNFERVVQFFRAKENQPQTFEQLMSGTKIPRGSLALVIYGKTKGHFVSQKTGIGKKLAWKLKSLAK